MSKVIFQKLGIFIKKLQIDIMTRVFSTILTALILNLLAYTQTDEIWGDSESDSTDSLEFNNVKSEVDINNWLDELPISGNTQLIGGHVQSIFREAIDSARVLFYTDGDLTDSVLTIAGRFSKIIPEGVKVIDIKVLHPDFHGSDTSFVLKKQPRTILWFNMEPRYKILLRGRAYAGNMPLEGVDVTVNRGADVYNIQTRGCYYDKEDYWNCLYDGMFKLELTADNPEDSIQISLNRDGMKPLSYEMTFKEYSGEIMQLRMNYESLLPTAPMNCLSLKLAFPFMSLGEDWFVSLSYHRLANETNWRRLAYGIEANMYINNLSVEQKTFDGVEPSQVDSSYIRAFVGPSIKFWAISPEHRSFSSYLGTTMALNLTDYEFVPQAFVGTRIFLDLNKAINLEIRYTEYDIDVVHYIFNPYGSSQKDPRLTRLEKLHAALGIQIAF